jgi:Na+-transporting methylmalonyl-CoA/oxaloacetate decarboxylase gamma subunit
MNVGQILEDILVIGVFVLLFIALLLYIAKSIYDFVKSTRREKAEKQSEEDKRL